MAHDHQHHDHHGHDHSKCGHDHGHPPAKRGLLKNWPVLVVLGLMLLGMIVYILTLDESRP